MLIGGHQEAGNVIEAKQAPSLALFDKHVPLSTWSFLVTKTIAHMTDSVLTIGALDSNPEIARPKWKSNLKTGLFREILCVTRCAVTSSLDEKVSRTVTGFWSKDCEWLEEKEADADDDDKNDDGLIFSRAEIEPIEALRIIEWNLCRGVKYLFCCKNKKKKKNQLITSQRESILMSSKNVFDTKKNFERWRGLLL